MTPRRDAPSPPAGQVARGTDHAGLDGSLLKALAQGSASAQIEAVAEGSAAYLLVYPALDLCFATQAFDAFEQGLPWRFRVLEQPPPRYERQMHRQLHWSSLRQLAWRTALCGPVTELVDRRLADSLCRIRRWPDPGQQPLPATLDRAVAQMARSGLTLLQIQTGHGLSRETACRLLNGLYLQGCLALAPGAPEPSPARAPHRHAGMFGRIRAALGI